MGAWGSGPFDNDDAADFLVEAQSSPSRAITKIMKKVASTPRDEYLEVTDGAPALAACELVALAFGRSAGTVHDDEIIELAGRVRPTDTLRVLALDALARLSAAENSEVAELWREGSGAAKFDASLADLHARLEDARTGRRELPKLKVGDIVTLLTAPNSTELVVVQVVGRSEVAIFDGCVADSSAALDCAKHRPACRVPISLSKLIRTGTWLANAPVRQDLKGTKLYVREGHGLGDYDVMTASFGGDWSTVPHEQARDLDVHCYHDEGDIRAVAHGTKPPARVRSPDEREEEWRALHDKEWARHRQKSKPGPFGDMESLTSLVEWMEQFGTDHAVRQFDQECTYGVGGGFGDTGTGRYAFAALVAIWRGAWPREDWPESLANRFPAEPSEGLKPLALATARTFAARLLTRDSVLRMIWASAADGGSEFRRIASRLQAALV